MAIEIIRVETKEFDRIFLGQRADEIIKRGSNPFLDRIKFVIAMNGRPLLQFDDYDSAEATARHLHEKWKAGTPCTTTILTLDTSPLRTTQATGPTNN